MTTRQSVIHLFQRPWFRRLFLVFLGLLLGSLYHYNHLTDYYFEPFLLSLIIGFWSDRLFSAYINYVIVLIGMVAAILVMAFASQLGAQAPTDMQLYLAITSQALMKSSVILLIWIPGLPAGFYLRKLIIEQVEKRQNQ